MSLLNAVDPGIDVVNDPQSPPTSPDDDNVVDRPIEMDHVAGPIETGPIEKGSDDQENTMTLTNGIIHFFNHIKDSVRR